MSLSEKILFQKYDLTKHPNYRYTSDADARNAFDAERFLKHRILLRENDEFEVVDVG